MDFLGQGIFKKARENKYSVVYIIIHFDKLN